MAAQNQTWYRMPLLWSCTARTVPRLSVAVATLLCAAVSGPLTAQDSIAIQNARIIPIVGDEIDSGTILIEDGRITDVGVDVKVPVSARVIDASGKVVLPGIINVHSSAGMSQSNEQNPLVPFLSVVDSIDPIRDFFDESRRLGVTTAAVVPGNSTMIGGRAAIVKTAGAYVDDMLVRRDFGLKISLSPVSGSSRMSHIARLRKELTAARDEIKDENEAEAKEDSEKDDAKEDDEDDKKESQEEEKEEKPESGDAPAAQQTTDNARIETYRKLLDGRMKAIIYCPAAMDVTQALALIDEFELKSVLVLGRECYRAADLVAERKLPVVLDSTLVYWRTDPQTREDEQILLSKLFSEAGADYVFQMADTGTSLGPHYPFYQAATAVRFGMSREDALQKLTLDAARVLGIDDVVGSIEKGKDADLVILTGDPLDVSTWVDMTLVNGRVVYERSDDARLQRLFNPEEDSE